MADKEKNRVPMVNRTPADMHADGVHFDPKIKEALTAERARRETKHQKDLDKK